MDVDDEDNIDNEPQPANPPPNNDDDDDGDESSEEEEESHHSDDEDENNEGGPRLLEDGSINGGVALNLNSTTEGGAPKKRPNQCDIILKFECNETIHASPDHAMLQPGIKIAIGLDKSTKLSAVFGRFVEFLAEQAPNEPVVTLADIEFAHVQLLHSNDTAETSALMKNDTVTVRNVRTKQRALDAEKTRLQRESDREFYKKMRLLQTDQFCCDIMLDCQGHVLDENGLEQKTLTTGVRAHSTIVSKRCPWLGRKIQAAREELERKSVVTLPEQQEDEEGDVKMKAEEEEKPQLQHVEAETNLAAQIGSSDDDEQLGDGDDPSSQSHLPDASRLLWVALPNHPPDAVRLLLEYCYTNRVVSLGKEAFTTACRTSGKSGPVPPFQSSRSRGWPQHGLPTIPFSVALSAIRLAEEAEMPRFSLMCEVAASQLVSPSTIVDALTLCTTQKQATGNSLSHLRKAAMDELLRHGQNGVERPTFRRALDDKEKSDLVVPSLLVGTMEAVHSEAKKKQKPIMFPYDDIDRADLRLRNQERRKSRKERRGEEGAIIDDDEDDDDDDDDGDGEEKLLRDYPWDKKRSSRKESGKSGRTRRRGNTSRRASKSRKRSRDAL